MSSPIERLNMVDGVFAKQMHFAQAGDVMNGHLHTHNHLTLLAHGSLRVSVNGQSTEFTAPHMIFIHKNHTHELVALENNTVAYCIHAVREKDTGDVIDSVIVPRGIIIEDLVVRNPDTSEMVEP